jgi:ABC-2 type transport system permease protein
VVVAVTALAGAAVAGALVAAGAGVAGALHYGAALFLAGAGAAALGGLTAQLVADRRRAVTTAAGILGAGLAARMVGEGADGWGWLLWVSPFGLLSLVEPFGADRAAPLGVLLGGVLVLGTATLLSARGRDLHAGLVSGSGLRPPRLLLLGSAGGFAVRRALGSLAAWGVGVIAYFLLIGGLASSLTAFLSDNPRYAELAGQAGFQGLGTVDGYVAALFALLAIPVCLFAANRISADAADEEAGRLALVFATPTTRDQWFVVNAVTALIGGLLLAVGAGVATWLGTTLVGAQLALPAALAGALNLAPVLLLSLGFALLALGWLPRAVFLIGSIPSAGGFLLQALADTLQWPAAVQSLSPFAHLNAVPAERPNWAGGLAMALIGLVLAAAGLLRYRRRDLQA